MLQDTMKGILARIKLKYVVSCVISLFILDFLGVFTFLLQKSYHHEFTYPLEIELQEVIETLRNGDTPSVQPINQYNYRFKIANEEKCKLDSAKDHQDIRLVYLIKSAISHRKERDAIRHSWGFEKRFSDVEIRRVFLLGVDPANVNTQDTIDQENEKHHDIVQANFVDSYYNNTIKTLVGLKWVVKNCPKAQFILLVDDDMYVSTKNLLRFARNPLGMKLVASRNKFEEELGDGNKEESYWFTVNPSDPKPVYDGRLYAGHVFFSAPQRHKSSKWYISLNEYPFSKYPPYVTAGAVCFTYPALLDMYYASFYTKHFKFDDIYLGILAKKVGIHPIHNNNMYFYKKEYSKEDYVNVVVSHGFGDSKELLRTWEEQKSLGNA